MVGIPAGTFARELALEFDAAASWLVLARDLTLVALLVVLMTEVRREPSRSA